MILYLIECGSWWFGHRGSMVNRLSMAAVFFTYEGAQMELHGWRVASWPDDPTFHKDALIVGVHTDQLQKAVSL